MNDMTDTTRKAVQPRRRTRLPKHENITTNIGQRVSSCYTDFTITRSERKYISGKLLVNRVDESGPPLLEQMILSKNRMLVLHVVSVLV